MACGALLTFLAAIVGKGPLSPPTDWSVYQDVSFLEVTRPENKISFCSGVRVRANLILTSAHCMDGAISARSTTSDDPKAATAKWVPLTSGWIHSGYDPKSSFYQNDIAAVCLSESANSFTPIWEWGLELPEGTEIDRIGWGMRDGRNARCWTDPKILGHSERGFWITHDDLGKPGDSGGPIFIREVTGKPRVIGLHSTWQKGKRTLKSYAVDVTAFRDWINSLHCPEPTGRDAPFSISRSP